MLPPPIPGIILAAGKGLRMGQNKLLLPFNNKPILQHVLDTAAPTSLSPLILVVRPESNKLQKQINRGRAIVITNHDALKGYSSSLQAGLKAIPDQCAGAMFLLGDQPLLQVDTIEKLVHAFQKEPLRWIAPSWRGQRGNPVITPASWFDRIFALSGDTGPRKHLKDSAANLKTIEVDDEGVVFDIDSREDYERLIL